MKNQLGFGCDQYFAKKLVSILNCILCSFCSFLGHPVHW